MRAMPKSANPLRVGAERVEEEIVSSPTLPRSWPSEGQLA